MMQKPKRLPFDYGKTLADEEGFDGVRATEEIDRVFRDAAAPGKPTEYEAEFLDFLWQNGIRSGVISNISFEGRVVKERIDRFLIWRLRRRVY